MGHPTSSEVYQTALVVQNNRDELTEREWEIIFLGLLHLHGAIVVEERGSEVVIRKKRVKA